MRTKRAVLRVRGHEDRMFRERVVGLNNRKQGFVEGIGAACSTVEVQSQAELLASLDRFPPMYYTNPDGSVWSPQNPDGSFVYPPGFDEPLV